VRYVTTHNDHTVHHEFQTVIFFVVLARLSSSPLFHHDRRLRIDSRRIFVPYADAGQAAGVVALAADLRIRMPQDCFLHNDVYLGHDDDQ
jgi:hypothetical protein